MIQSLRAQVDMLTRELVYERAKTSQPSNNISHGFVRSAVLKDEKLIELPKVESDQSGFNKDAWTPPEDASEDTKTNSKEPVKTGFNKSAWAPPNDNT